MYEIFWSTPSKIAYFYRLYVCLFDVWLIIVRINPDFVFKCTLAILLLPIFVTVVSALTAGVTSKFVSDNNTSPPAEEAAQPETDVDEEEGGKKESFFV